MHPGLLAGWGSAPELGTGILATPEAGDLGAGILATPEAPDLGAGILITPEAGDLGAGILSTPEAPDLGAGTETIPVGDQSLGLINKVTNDQAPDTAGSAIPLTDLAEEVRASGLHPAAVNQRAIAVGANSEGELFAGSSNGFDAGQRAALERLGITRVPGYRMLHAEEELVIGVPDLQRIGVSGPPVCGPEQHNCLGLLANHRVVIEQ